MTRAGCPWLEWLQGVARKGCPGAELLRVKANSPAAARVTWEVGSKQQKCRMQHAGGGGHPHIWVQVPAWGGSPPTAGMGVWAQNSFPHAKIIWQIVPVGVHGDVE